jgi:hypothetical protein
MKIVYTEALRSRRSKLFMNRSAEAQIRIVYHGGTLRRRSGQTPCTEFAKILIDEIFSLCPPCLGGAISESLCLCDEIIHHGGTECTERT